MSESGDQRRKKRKKRSNGPGRIQRNDYAQWLALIDSDRRQILARVLKEADIAGIGSFRALGKSVLVALAAGDLDPTVATEMRAWTEFLFDVEMEASGRGGVAANAALQALAQAIEGRAALVAAPAYTVLDVIEVEPAKVEGTGGE